MESELRRFTATIQVKLEGYVPDIITTEHIRSNVQALVAESLGEVSLHGEAYNIDDEWSVFMKLDPDVVVSTYKVKYRPLPFCENCGERHQVFGIEVHNEGLIHCLQCYNVDDKLIPEEVSIIEESHTKAYRDWLELTLKHIPKV